MFVYVCGGGGFCFARRRRISAVKAKFGDSLLATTGGLQKPFPFASAAGRTGRPGESLPWPAAFSKFEFQILECTGIDISSTRI